MTEHAQRAAQLSKAQRVGGQELFARAATRVLENYNYIPPAEERPERFGTGDEQGKTGGQLTPEDMDAIYRINQQGAERSRARAMNEVPGYQYGTASVGFGTNSDPILFGWRRNYEQELNDPAVRERLFSLAHREVGTSDPAKTIGFLEGVINRANSRHQTIMQAASDAGYYPGSSLRSATLEPEHTALYSRYLDTVLGGSNVSNFSTGNASMDPTTGKMVGFNRGVVTSVFGRGKNTELGGLEGPDFPWYQQMTGLPSPPPAVTVPYRPGAEGGEATGAMADINAPGGGYNAGPAAFEAAQAAQPAPPAKPTGWDYLEAGLHEFGKDVREQGEATAAKASAAVSAAEGAVPTGSPLLQALAADPTAPLRNAIAMSTPVPFGAQVPQTPQIPPIQDPFQNPLYAAAYGGGYGG
jgi:hypothetical protein